jgi:hypothetical protein
MILSRRLRAGISLGLVWGVSWAVAGVGLITWRVFFANPRLAFPFQYWPRFALTAMTLFGIAGFAAGLVFATLLRRRAKAHSIDTLPAASAARWGAVAGAATVLVLPLVGFVPVSFLLGAGAVMSAIGAASAVATIKTARRGAPLNHAANADALSS